MKPIDILIALVVPLSWGLGLVMAKPAVDQFPPILLMAMRFGLAALVLVWFVPVPRKLLRELTVIAFVVATLQYGLTFYGLRYLDASTTALIVQSETPFLLLVGVIWLGERLNMVQIAGMVVAFVGIIIITGAPKLEGQWLGISMVLAGSATWAFGQAMMRRLNARHPGALSGLSAIAWIAVLSTPQLFLASLIFERGHWAHIAGATPYVWLTVAYLGLIMTALGYACWYHVLGRYPASHAAPFLLLIPVSSVTGAWLFLDEALSVEFLIGGMLTMLGVAIMTLVGLRRAPVRGR